MRYILTISLLLTGILSSFSQENPTLVDIPHEVFVNGGKTDFESFLFVDASLKEKVQQLHKDNELGHEHAFDFKLYWNHYKDQWHYIQFHESKEVYLIFIGLKFFDDEREYVEIFDIKKDGGPKLIYSTIGRLLAYKHHSFTNELVLFIHEYPCCRSASHSIYTVRNIGNDINIKKRFFVGRDIGDMVGPFFPMTVNFSDKYEILKEKTELRWSPAIVEENAYINWTHSNFMIHYNPGAVYKVLHEINGWQFVIMYSGIAEEQSMVLNYTNFKYTGVYGWIKI